MTDDERMGQRIIDAIVSGGLMRASCPDHPESACLVVWAENAAEQIGATGSPLRGAMDAIDRACQRVSVPSEGPLSDVEDAIVQIARIAIMYRAK